MNAPHRSRSCSVKFPGQSFSLNHQHKFSSIESAKFAPTEHNWKIGSLDPCSQLEEMRSRNDLHHISACDQTMIPCLLHSTSWVSSGNRICPCGQHPQLDHLLKRKLSGLIRNKHACHTSKAKGIRGQDAVLHLVFPILSYSTISFCCFRSLGIFFSVFFSFCGRFVLLGHLWIVLKKHCCVP